MTLEGLQSLIDAYGADTRRWPEGRREAGEALLACSPQARAMQADAVIFDRLIAEMPQPDEARLAALSARIVERALSERGGGAAAALPTSLPSARGDNVVPLPIRKSHKSNATSSEVETPSGPARSGADRSFMRPAAALAASLLLGIAIGLADLTPVSQLGFTRYDTASLSDAELVLSGLQNDTLSLLDEDQL